MAAMVRFSIDEHDAGSALAVVGVRDDPTYIPVYRYEGPFGPVHEAHTDQPPITRLWGERVPIGTFTVGSAVRGEYGALPRGAEPIASGAIGHQPVTVRTSARADARVSALTVALGSARYELTSSGIVPRVTLYRDDLSLLATYAVLGRRPHRISHDVLPEEVVLAAFLARFAMRLAYRR